MIINAITADLFDLATTSSRKIAFLKINVQYLKIGRQLDIIGYFSLKSDELGSRRSSAAHVFCHAL